MSGGPEKVRPTPRHADLALALAEAFSRRELAAHLREHLGKDPKLSAADSSDLELARDVVLAAEAEGWTHDLVLSLVHAPQPGRKTLAVLVGTGLGRDALQGFINHVDPLVLTEPFAEAIADARGRVFLVTVDGKASGSGFLVGPDIALTSYHVLEDLFGADGVPLDGASQRAKAVFDRSADGRTSRTSDFARDWHVASSRFHDLDTRPGEHHDVDLASALDFALVRLSEEIGLNMSPHGGGRKRRGWYALRHPEEELAEGQRVSVFGHPHGRPLMHDQGRVRWTNSGATRVRYDVNTAHGMSGAACLDNKMRLVAIHASSDAGAAISGNPPAYNQGIPIGRIASCILEGGHAVMLRDPPVTADSPLEMAGGEPVVGRLPLQRIAHMMCCEGGPRLLLVDGKPGSGRQFARAIIRGVTERYDQTHVPVLLEATMGWGAKDLCELIAIELGWDGRRIPERQPGDPGTKWTASLAAWLCGEVGRRFRPEQPLWLTFDCVRIMEHVGDVREFIVGVALRSFDLASLRVAMIGAQDHLPTNLLARAERHLVGPIGVDEVAEYFVRLGEARSSALPADKAEEFAGLVMGSLPAAGEGRWERMAALVNEFRKGIGEPGGPQLPGSP